MCFFAMQLIEGASLDKVLLEVKRLCSPGVSPQGDTGSTPLAHDLLHREGRLSRRYFESVARLIKDAAEALEYAHAQGVLHRDVKPSNLMLDASGRVWVTDFGLAWAEGADDLTTSGQVLGTLRYLAPEGLRGIADERSDVYSLGMTLHELLALEPGFTAENRAALIEKVEAGAPRTLREILPQIPAPLETIVLKATCKDPAQRYRSALELAADLDRFLDGRRPLGRLPLFDRRLRRSRLVRRTLQASAVALVLLAAVLGSFALLPRRPLKPQDLLLQDVNGDRKVDLVVANNGLYNDGFPDSIAILYNRGEGSFDRPVFVEVGDSPLGLVRANLHRDSHPEMVFAGSGSRDISLLRLESNGSFSPVRLVELQGRPSGIVVQDLDQDGHGDIAATFSPSRDVLVLWNDAGNKFPESMKVPVGPVPFFIGAVDLDNDGDVDLVTTNGLGQPQPEANVSVVMNGGRRQFEAATDYDVGNPALGFTTGDFNTDSFPDLAVTQQRKPIVSVFINAKDGTFPATAAERSLPDLIWTLASADLDDDGDLDLAGAGGERFAFLLRGDGQGAFSDPVSLAAGTQPAYVKPADLDGDADLDLAITNLGSEDITLLFNQGRGTFGRVRTVDLRSWFSW